MELRVYVHDSKHPHHDKDYRSFSAFPVSQSNDKVLNIVRVDYWNRVCFERLVGAGATEDSPPVWALIRKGHLCALKPPPDLFFRTWVEELAKHTMSWGAGLPIETSIAGWEAFLDQSRGWAAGPVGPPDETCKRCRVLAGPKPAPRHVGDVRPIPPPHGGYEDEGGAAVLAGWGLRSWGSFCQQKPPLPTTVTVPGPKPVAQEVLGGSCRWTAAWRAEGLEALEPAELYNNPDRKEGPRPEFDILLPEVQARLPHEAWHGRANICGLEPVP